MAFGISPKYQEQILLDNLTPQHFLTLMAEAVKKLGWDIGHTSPIGFVAYTGFSMASFSEEVKVTIDGDTANLKSECTSTQMVDWGKNKRNIQELVATFNQLKTSVGPEEIETRYQQLQANFAPAEHDVLSQPPPTTKSKFKNFLSIFIPAQGYFVTPILINLNILVFILMVAAGVNFLEPDNQSLISWGANFTPLTLDGQWWRLLSNCFLHIGIFHLAMNMYALAYIGILLEPHLGKARFAAAYLLTGIAASLASLWWHSITVSAGASGAIFGMYGVFLALLTTNFIERSARKTLLTSIGIFVVYNLLNGMKAGIDNAAHVGGLMTGVFIGYAYVGSLKKPADTKLSYIVIAVLSVVILTASTIVYKHIPNNLAEYDERMKAFTARESMALEVFKMKRDAPKEDLLAEIKDRGIYYWNENIKLLTDLDKLNLPDNVHDRDKQLLNYCRLRIKSYNLLYKMVNENTDKYNDSLKYYNTNIKAIIDSIKEK
jgi:rhomboid protease GluP